MGRGEGEKRVVRWEVGEKDKKGRLKVPKCEIFDRSDFDDFYTIKSLCEGDFRVKKKILYKNIWRFI